MKSKIYPMSNLIRYSQIFFKDVSSDKITVHAAEASFFTITSAVPFLSLFIAIVGLIVPGLDEKLSLGGDNSALSFILDKLSPAPGVSIISFSAITALWSASRGVGAVRGGIETVYQAERGKNYFIRRIKSIISTVIFISILTSIASLILFGDLVIGMFDGEISHIITRLRIPLFITVVTILFTCVYASIAKRSEILKNGFIYHIPGAFFSALGWVVFSYFYSLYIANFPGASYIYGSLGAICLIMLWIYFCMIILLLGAEINKFFFTRRKH